MCDAPASLLVPPHNAGGASHIARVCCIVWVILFLHFVQPQVARAHARVVQASPADNASLKESPATVQLEFTEPVSLQFSSFRVLDVNGRTVSREDAATLDATRKHATLSLPKLSDGIYSVVWKVISDRDGHSTRGHIVFGVGNAAPVTAAVSGEDSAPSGVEVVLRWFNLICLSFVAGGLVVAWVCLRGSVLQSWALRWSLLWSGLAMLAGFGLLVQQVQLLAGSVALDASAILSLLTQTSWGHAWVLRMGALGVFAICGLWPRRAMWTLPIMLISILALSMAQALSSHAGQSLLTLGLQAMHFLAASVWMGGLVVMVCASVLLVRRREGDQ